LGRINGSPTYLAVLREAYRGYVKELRQAKQETEAQRYQQRLQILDPGAALDGKTPAALAASAAAKTAPAPAAKPEPKIRLIREDEEAVKAKADAKPSSASTLLARAEEEFAKRRYREAGALFEQAHQADANIIASSRERWAYCKLSRVID